MTRIDRGAAPAEGRRPAKPLRNGPSRYLRTVHEPYPTAETGQASDGVRHRPVDIDEPALDEALFGMYYLG